MGYENLGIPLSDTGKSMVNKKPERHPLIICKGPSQMIPQEMVYFIFPHTMHTDMVLDTIHESLFLGGVGAVYLYSLNIKLYNKLQHADW